MNIQDTPELAQFRAEVRAFIDEQVPPQLKGLRQGIVQGPGLSAEALQPLEDALARKGWQAPSWPVDAGGAGFDLGQLVVFQEEWVHAGLPQRFTPGRDMLGPILIRYGTEEQKRRFLEPTRRGDIVWAQGYSEPQAGSDLAALQLRAEVVDGGFVLNGQKIWTSHAHESDWLFLLARTDPKPRRKQEGISFLLCDLRSEGVSIRPIITYDGFKHFCETFFDNVFVPENQLVGELHQGWSVAKALLGHERFTHPTADPLVIGRALDDVKRLAREMPEGDGVLWDDPEVRRRITQLEMDVECMRATRYRALSKVLEGGAPGPETQIFKIYGAELMQRIVALQQELAGVAGTQWGGDAPFGPELGEIAVHAANIRAASIRGGTTEIQRNVIAKRVLALPD